MITSLLVLLPLLAVAVWAFVRFAPIHVNYKAVHRFNLFSFALAVLLVIAWVVRTYIVMTPTGDSAWWPVISLLGALFIFPLVLAVAAIARNFVVFRRHAEAPPK